MYLQTINNEPRVSHRIIAENTGNEARSVYRIINENKSDFEEFGTLRFEITRIINDGKGNQPKTYYLNEAQATLLFTYLRNSEIVKQFKKALVKEFFLLRQRQVGSFDEVLLSLKQKSSEADAFRQKYYNALERENELLRQKQTPQELGFKPKKKGGGLLSLAEKQRIKALFANGYSKPQIARELSRREASVYRVLQ